MSSRRMCPSTDRDAWRAVEGGDKEQCRRLRQSVLAEGVWTKGTLGHLIKKMFPLPATHDGHNE